MTTPGRSYVCPVLIGRTAQLQALERALREAKEDEPSAVILSGEAGIGKSRLVSETATRAATLGFTILRGDCFEAGRSLPFSAVQELLRAYLATHPLDEALELLGSEASDIGRVLPELATRFGDVGSSLSADAELEKRRIFHAFVRVLVRLAGQRPLLVVFEDLHWCDETTLEFLQFLCRYPGRQSSNTPMLVLMTYRSDEIQPALAHFLAELDRTRSAVELALGRLTMAETDVMMRTILDMRQPSRKDFLQTLHVVTGGNPFFIEEVLNVSAASGSLELVSTAGPGIDLTRVPRTVQDAVRQRAARLSPLARRFLDVAAVAGVRFNLALLGAVTGQEPADLLAPIKELVDAQLVIEDGSTFAFRHALTRQAIYTQLLVVERIHLHRQIGDALERLYQAAPDFDAHAGDLAYHFYEGEAWDKALRYCERAGQQAFDLFTPAAVIQHLGRAREAARRLGQTPPPRLLRQLAAAYEVVGEFDSARLTMEAAIQAAERAGDERERWEALIGLGSIWSSRDYSKTGVYWRAALTAGRATADEAVIAHSLNRIGNWHLNVEEPVEAVTHHHEALRIFEASRDENGVAETLDLLGMSSYLGGDLSRCRAHYERALDLFEHLRNTQGYISSLSTLAVCAPVYHSDTLAPSVAYAQAVEWLERARDMAVEMGWRAGESYALWDLGLVHGPAGEYDRAIESASNGLAIAEDIGHLEWISGALFTLGSVLLDVLDFAAARRALERAYETAVSTGSLHWRRCTAGFLVRCCLSQGDNSRAAAVLDENPETRGQAQTLGERVMRIARAEMALANVDGREALRLVDSLIATAGSGAGAAPPRLARLRGDALAQLKDFEGAEVAFRDGIKTAEEQQQHGHLWRMHAALSRLYRAQGQRTRSLEESQAALALVERLAGNIPTDTQRKGFVAAVTEDLPTQGSQRQAAKLAFGGLTEREREIARLIAGGLSNAGIARELVISERTVETHVANILGKLTFSSRVQIAAWAAETGLTTHA